MNSEPSTTLLPNWLGRCAENYPQRLALQCGATAWSFQELDRQVTLLACQLATIGVQEKCRVALLAASGPAYVVCVHALTRLGAMLVPLNTRLTQDELRWQLCDVQASVLLSDTRYSEIATALGKGIPALVRATITMVPATQESSHQSADTILLIEADNDHDKGKGQEAITRPQRVIPATNISLRTLIDLHATQVIMYTSGTTGQPKGVIITYGMQWWSAIGSALNLGHSPDDCWLACLPLFHIGGLSMLMKSVIYGIGIIVQEKFEPEQVNKAINEYGVTIISVVAVMLQRMLAALDRETNSKAYPATLRCILLGGGPVPYPLLEECARRSIPVVQTYGLTESCSQAVTLAPADALRKLGSVGRPLLPVQLRIMRDDQPVQPSEAGIIYLKGPTITPGYADRLEETERTMRDGWLSTGDMGYLDEEGYLYILDRRTDLIISGGENIYPAEIEGVLATHPAIAEVAVIARPDPKWGEVGLAVVVPRTADLTAEEVIAFCSDKLARYKIPRAVVFTDVLPRNAMGKVMKAELRTKVVA